MNRSFTAAVALAAVLGTASLALAQSASGPANSPTGAGNSGTTAAPMTPSTGMPPAQPQGAASTYGTQAPQANAQGMQQPGSQMSSRAGQANLSQSEIIQAQQELKAQGLYNGQLDGIVGPETQTAVSQFQQQQGLPQTAMLDQQTLDRLMQRGNNAAPNTTNR
jgi:peptidoglycan hydrolase-like protein with peptidoglycan-binding domain